MLDISNLERRWLKYKIKTYAPWAGGVLALCLVGGIAAFWFLPSRSEKPVAVPTKPAVPQTSPAAAAPQPVEPENNATVLEPSMGFILSFNDTPSATAPAPSPAPSKGPKPPVLAAGAVIPPPTVLNVPEPPVSTPRTTPPPETSKVLSINRSEAKLDIDELQKRFKETPNPNLGLFIARYYYDRGNYAEAYNYALKTNAINNQIDESWILFCKSLAKLGKTDQAKKTLQVYLSQSNSDSARELLNALEKGTFR